MLGQVFFLALSIAKKVQAAKAHGRVGAMQGAQLLGASAPFVFPRRPLWCPPRFLGRSLCGKTSSEIA